MGEGGGDLGGVGGREGCQEVSGLPCSLLLLCGALCTASLIAHAKLARLSLQGAMRGGASASRLPGCVTNRQSM